jgi:hypothetical protein
MRPSGQPVDLLNVRVGVHRAQMHVESAARVRQSHRSPVSLPYVTATELRRNPLRSREDMQRAVLTLCAAAEPYLTAGGARLRVGRPDARHSQTCQEFEGFSRLLWGIAPLLAGGGRFPLVHLLQQGLVNGCDPTHAEYWGAPIDYDQRLVECAGIAAALLLAPSIFWAPLSRRQRTSLSVFLGWINQRRVRDNNWLFFRVLVNVALAVNDAPFSSAQIDEDLQRIDGFYRGHGWYVDGPAGMADYYGPWAMHFYGLLCAPHLKGLGNVRSACLLERAEQFASEFIHWFSSDGSALPYGRSLTYRFAQSAFWSALTYAGTSAVAGGVIKGIVLRHLRWWLQRPICTESGLLSIGYGYPHPLMAEGYNSSCSPYWALKAFLPLALGEKHPFWTAVESRLPALPAVVPQPQPQMIVCRHRSHVFALGATSRTPKQHRHAAEKYNKFCYSTCFAFSVPSGQRSLQAGAHDSMLALSEGEDDFRVRHESEDVRLFDGAVVARWRPWPDVQVTTWLVAVVPWHVRVHLVESCRPLRAAEGGFALGAAPDWEAGNAPVSRLHRSVRSATAANDEVVSIIVDLNGTRECHVLSSDPNTNLLNARTVIPTLLSTHATGTHWLGCAVLGGTRADLRRRIRPSLPRLVWEPEGFVVFNAGGEAVFAHHS